MKLDAHPQFAFLSGGGKLAELIAAFDWSQTSLGRIEAWTPTLRTSVALALRSAVPIVMLWGKEGVMIYNDAYSVFAGLRHPTLLGSRVREGWSEVSDFNDNVMNVVLGRGETLAYKSQELTLYRNGVAEQIWMDLDYSPIIDDSGEPVAVLAIVVETTAKVEAERWLAAERQRMSQMFEQAPGFIAMLVGPDHVFEFTNNAYLQLIGHRDVVGSRLRDALPEVVDQGFNDLLDKVYQTGEPFIGRSFQVALQRTLNAPPEDRFVDFIYQPFRDTAGAVVGIFVEGADVTERVLAEQSVRESEAQFRLFAEAMPNHVWTAPSSGQLDWFNGRVYQYSGLSAEELNGDGWTSIVHPDDLPGAGKQWGESLSTGRPYETEFRLRRHDGAYRWHIARAVAVSDAQGRPARWIGTNTDIDDQKRVEQRLADSERRFRLSQNAGGIGSLELDIPSGTVIGSERFWELWGLTPRESVPIRVLENIVIPEDKDVRSTAETRRQGTAKPSVEYRIRRPDTGELRWLSRDIEFLYGDSGEPLKMFGVMQDITEKKEAETRQQTLLHELEHRIKNTLAMVSAIASQTLRNTDLDSARATFTERLSALAKAHDVLTNTRWTEAMLGDVVVATTSALPPERRSIAGPLVALTPKRALSISLAINELATNALKYGALSTEGGSIDISWSILDAGTDGGRSLYWRWKEQGGPQVTPPTRRGFGRFLIERVLAADFEGTVRIDYAAGGVECILEAPLPKHSATDASEAGI